MEANGTSNDLIITHNDKEILEIKEKLGIKRKNENSKKQKKSIQNFLNTYGDYETTEKKLFALANSYLLANRETTMIYEKMNQQLINCQREKERLETEKNKAVLFKDKYSNMFQDLSFKYKTLKVENISKLKDEEDKRKEESINFQKQYEELKDLLCQLNEKNAQLNNDNDNIQHKYNDTFQRMQVYKKLMDNTHVTLKNEIENLQSSFTKTLIRQAQSEEHYEKDRNELLLEINFYKNKILEKERTESELHKKLDFYAEKYSSFESTLTESSKLINEYKEKMTLMTKNISILESEKSSWKANSQNNYQTLLYMTNLMMNKNKQIKRLTMKCDKFESLCKAFQEQRSKLLLELKKSNNLNNKNALQVTPATDNEQTNDEVKYQNDMFEEQNIEKINQVNDEVVEANNSTDDTENTNTDANKINEEVNCDILEEKNIEKNFQINNQNVENNSMNEISNFQSDMLEEKNIENIISEIKKNVFEKNEVPHQILGIDDINAFNIDKPIDICSQVNKEKLDCDISKIADCCIDLKCEEKIRSKENSDEVEVDSDILSTNSLNEKKTDKTRYNKKHKNRTRKGNKK